MGSAIPDPSEFRLPRPGWLCRMSKGFELEDEPELEEMFFQDAYSPPYLFLFREEADRVGKGEDFLLAHRMVRSCWEGWEIDEARFPLRVSKRAALDVTINTQVVVYTSRAAALSDLAVNYPGNRLLTDLTRSAHLDIRRAAEAVLAGEVGAAAALAGAAEAAGDDRAGLIHGLSFRAS